MSIPSRKYFGTDGVRGQANQGKMLPQTLIQLALAAGTHFIRGPHRHTVVIGKDTRLSGYMVESALTAGFTSIGFEVVRLGPLPTPAVALLTKSLRADMGVMISASHNPYQDNGIKFFGPDGYKLSDSTEMMIERTMDEGAFDLAKADHIGKARVLTDASGRYIEFAKSTFPKNLRLDGLKIVLDCAHGAAYKVAPAVLWELGADIVTIGSHPDGKNINDKCGATHVDLARETLIKEKADVAVILDGDADRIIMLDEDGKVVDGDTLLALIATYFLKNDRLTSPSIIATQMSNLGLERYLTSKNLNLVRTHVGDRYVIDSMRQVKSNLGGEQSGHIILHDYSTTGDGLIAALQVLAIMQENQARLSKLAHIYTPVPQVLKNVRLQKPLNLKNSDIQEKIAFTQRTLKDGHLLVRASGTEPLLRLMAQGDDDIKLHEILDDLADFFTKIAHAH